MSDCLDRARTQRQEALEGEPDAKIKIFVARTFPANEVLGGGLEHKSSCTLLPPHFPRGVSNDEEHFLGPMQGLNNLNI